MPDPMKKHRYGNKKQEFAEVGKQWNLPVAHVKRKNAFATGIVKNAENIIENQSGKDRLRVKETTNFCGKQPSFWKQSY